MVLPQNSKNILLSNNLKVCLGARVLERIDGTGIPYYLQKNGKRF
jgi:hypothetical protein